jgi:hypothetical protein
MNDLSHYYGGDIAVSPTGDLAPIDGAVRGQQRILRRLLTNPGDYIWHPDYGAGLPQYVGQTLDAPKLKALILGQMRMEDCVAKTPTRSSRCSRSPAGSPWQSSMSTQPPDHAAAVLLGDELIWP